LVLVAGDPRDASPTGAARIDFTRMHPFVFTAQGPVEKDSHDPLGSAMNRLVVAEEEWRSKALFFSGPAFYLAGEDTDRHQSTVDTFV
jgi:hypothetical protein